MYNLKKRFVTYFFACLSSILLSSPQTWADTYVSGVITTAATWTKANGPYIVTGNLGIEKNATLTIESGVQVLVDGGYYIGIKGKIIANGSENEPIVFTTKNNEYGWQGIQFITDVDGGNTWQGSLFNYVEISHAHRGISSNNGIGSSEPLITITNSLFDTIGYDGIYLWGLPCVIENNYFTNINGNPGYHYAINARGPIITKNIIENSKSSGILGNVNCGDCPNPIISGNRLTNLGGAGIDGTESIITNNLIFNNDVGIIATLNSEVHYNTIYNNNIGIISTHGNFISNNNIFSNIQWNLKNVSQIDMLVDSNWWGELDLAGIGNFIYDYYDDFTLGKVNYIPFLTSPDPDAPPIYRNIYRFWSNTFLGHFYTISEEEKDYVIATWPDTWKYEGPAFYAYPSQVNGTLPVYRFWSNTFLGHFYTISEEEKDYVIATWPDTWKYEGPAFYAYPSP
jgi:hypothetical protein